MRAYPRVEPAILSTTSQWISDRFDDAYFSMTDPLGERQAIFVEGLALPEQIRRLESGQVLRIGETGFGAGLSFIMASACFLANAPAGARLQWVSCERYPLSQSQLEALWQSLSWPSDCQPLLAALKADWPDAVACPHRRIFADGRIVLDLHYQDAESVFSGLSGPFDAWCLDGFSPNRNPSMWTERLYQAIADCSRPGARLSTYTAASAVRQGLESVGFSTQKVPGFGGKRERLCGQYAPASSPTRDVWGPPPAHQAPRAVTIVGAGLSGAWLARKLAERGVAVTVFERHQPAEGASGNPQGIAYAKLSVEATPASLMQLQALMHLGSWLKDAPEGLWHPSGLLIAAQTEQAAIQQRKLIDSVAHNPGVCEAVSVEEASELAGTPLSSGGLWIPRAGWMHPKALVRWLLTYPGIEVKAYHQVASEMTQDTRHHLTLLDAQQKTITHATDTLVWANAGEAQSFCTMPLNLKAIRGQITRVRGSVPLRVPLSGSAYVAPGVHGETTCGATYAPNSTDLTPSSKDDWDNLERTNALFKTPVFSREDILGNRVSLRASTPDYAPLVGALADPSAWLEPLKPLTQDATFQPSSPLPYLPGLYILAAQGSRGTLTAPMTAEIVASQICGEVLPVSSKVRDALAPDRFFRRDLIRHGIN